MALFQHSVLNRYLSGLDEDAVDEAWKIFTAHFHNAEVQKNIREAKEESYQEGFLDDLFVKVLGYTKSPAPEYNLVVEQKNLSDSKKADGALLDGEKIRGVIELKGTETTDLSKVESQAFGYKNKQPDAIYVVISNFEKLRFYIDNAVDYIEFNLFTLTKREFKILWLCLGYPNFLKGLPKKIKDASVTEEENVTKKLYKDYSDFKHDIFDSVKKHNPDYDALLLFKKTQKLLDRFLFIFFAEDRNLLPPNSIKKIIQQWHQLKELDEYRPLYERFIKYFGYLNEGRKVSGKDEIFAYNGGLFAEDEVLDNLTISDELLYKHTLKLSTYDFVSEVDVNILGHIFEHSLNEIEEITAELEGEEVDRSKTRRKKDGVYYTPKYITKYIVEHTVGKLCEEQKSALDIDDEAFRPNRQKKTKKELLGKLEEYREWLLGVTICDPACGSGAFLNQALEFLIAEHAYVDELQAKLLGESMVLPDVENQILERNLFGVDINEESVEIAKLSLWLRTAQKGRKLTSLNHNIKCGNSLIDDPDVAGEKAFDWEAEFPSVFENGGFDVVIGNPPYGILIDETSKKYFEEHFPLTSYKINLYVLFIERMLQVFNKGVVHFIIPKSLLFNSYYEGIRKYLIKNTEVNEIFTITEKVFQDAEVGSSLLLKFSIRKSPKLSNITRLATAETVDNFVTKKGLVENHKPQNSFLKVPKNEITIVSLEVESILVKLQKLSPLEDYYSLKNGLNPGNIKHILISDKKENEDHKPIIWGKDISKYHIAWSGDFVNYNENIDESISLDDVKSKKGMNKQERIDFALRSPELFESEKIVVRKTGDSLIANLDKNSFYFDTLVHGIYQEREDFPLKYLLGIINSNPATEFYRMLHDIKGKTFAKISLTNLGLFPIPEAGNNEINGISENVDKQMELMNSIYNVEKKFQDILLAKFDIEKLSRKLQSWHELTFKQFLKELKKKKVKLSLDEEAEWLEYFQKQKAQADELKAQITQTDKEIDAMVYELYGLSEEEVKVVEKNLN
jgi:hypothetical protein